MALATQIRDIEYFNTNNAFTDNSGDNVTSTSYVTLQRDSTDVVLDKTGDIGAAMAINVIIQAITAAGTEEYYLKVDDGDANDFSGEVQSTEFEVDKATATGKLFPFPEIVVKHGYLRVQSKVANSGDWTVTSWLAPDKA